MKHAVDLTAPFDRPAIERAIAEVLARHPMRHDEWRLGCKLDQTLEPFAP